MEIWLIWLRDGKYGDTELMVARSSREGAMAWCDQHRQLANGAPVSWHRMDDGTDYGESKVAQSLGKHGKHGKHHTTYHYYFQIMKVEED